MWIISDETLNQLLGGNYESVIYLKQKEPTLSVRELFCVQFVYASYDGFRKFYNKKLSKVLNGLKRIPNSSLLAKILKVITK